jgi:copper(I)-binding protein
MSRHRVAFGAILAGLLLAGCDSPTPPTPPTGDAAAGPQAVDPWIRAAPPVASVMAGYLTLEAGSRDIEVSAAECDGFGTTEIHETRTVDGVASMRRVEHVPVTAGEAVEFEPGGLHLMLMSPARIPGEGESVRCRLRLADGSTLAFEATVRPGDDDVDHAHHHH